jgi:signal peptidase I
MSGIDAADVIVDLLRRGHAVQFRVHGDSMHPVIRAEDVVHVEPSLPFAIGDVVLTQAERGLTTHRVVSVRGNVVVTRGDNVADADPPLDRSRVLGVVTYAERNARHLGVRRRGAAALVLRIRRWIRKRL